MRESLPPSPGAADTPLSIPGFASSRALPTLRWGHLKNNILASSQLSDTMSQGRYYRGLPSSHPDQAPGRQPPRSTQQMARKNPPADVSRRKFIAGVAVAGAA